MTLETGLLIACTASSLIAAALLVFLLLRGKRAKRDEADAAQRIDAAIDLLGEKLNGARVLTVEQLDPIATGLGRLCEEVAGVAHLVEEIPARIPPGAASPVALEHQILEVEWNQFCANKELAAAYESAALDNEWHVLLDELTNVVPSDLKPTFDVVIGPCREHRTIVQRIGFIPRIIAGKFPRLETDAEEVRRTRELTGLLRCDANRLGFRFQSWVTETFLPFADLYLQRHQQAQFEKRQEELQLGATLVRQLLRMAAVEPVEVTLGETLFDSARHIGRSTTNDPHVPDGVITGVIRNGFIEEQQVIRQPEVIVNRNR
jgi:hypothetical protein